MPLILHEEDEARWLAGDLDGLVAPFPSQLMRVEQVQPRQDGPALEQDERGEIPPSATTA